MPRDLPQIGRDAEKALAAFRGIPFVYSHAESKRIRPVGDFLPAIIRAYSIDGVTPEQTIMEHWEEIVGPTFVPFSYLMKLDKGKNAIIGVSHATARQELTLRKREILRRIRRLPGCSQIAFLHFRAG